MTLYTQNNRILIKEYREGNKQALNYLIQNNQSLIHSIANQYAKYLQTSELEDLVQEGNIALLRAIDIYDGKHSLSTIAHRLIEQSILRYIHSKDRLIIRPPEAKIYKYSKIKNECFQNHTEYPTDEELCDLLNVSRKQLQVIKDEAEKTIFSFHMKVGENKEHEFGDFLEDDSFHFENIVDKMDTQNLLIVLKNVLTPKEYYVLYYKSICPKNENFRKMLKYFSRSTLRVTHENAIKKVKLYLDPKKRLFRNKLKQLEQSCDLSKLNYLPLDPVDILKYEYIKDSLTDLEKKLFYLKFVEKHSYTIKDYMLLLNVSKEQLNGIAKRLKVKIREYFQNEKKWQIFKRETLEKQKLKIFDVVIKNDMDYQELNENYQELSDVGGYISNLTRKEQQLLERYFNIPEAESSLEELEKKLNLKLLDYESKDTRTPLNLLYPFFLETKELYSEEQQQFIETYIFNHLPKKSFWKKYPNSNCNRKISDYWLQLEKKYYFIPNFLNKTLQKRHYLEIKEQLPEEKREALENYFNGSGNSKTIYNDKAFAINTLLNRDKSISKELYKPILPVIMEEVDDLNQLILSMYFMDNLSYDEILEKIQDREWINKKIALLELDISWETVVNNIKNKKRLSNMILRNISKMDDYRFQIKSSRKIATDSFEQVLSYFSSYFNETEKEILRCKYIANKKSNYLSQKFQQSAEEIEKLNSKFRHLYRKYLIKDIEVEEKDFISEMELHPSERILSEEQQEFLSFYFGVPSPTNPKGEKLSKKQIEQRLNVVLNHKIDSAKDLLKWKKIGQINKIGPKREELDKILDDPHVPIDDNERILLCKLFELKGYPYVHIKTLAKEENKDVYILETIYQNIIKKIMKYLNHEIVGKQIYESDIEPYLKYFSKSNQHLIQERYQRKKSLNQISKECGLTIAQITDRMMKIDYELYCIRKKEYVELFDFDSVEKAFKDPHFPYDGDKYMMKEVFDLYFGQKTIKTLNLKEIIEYLHLSCNLKVLENNLYEFMISVCKWNAKIRKSNSYSKNEVREFYETHKNNLTKEELIIFQKYFNKLLQRKREFQTPEEITSIILKHVNPNYINLQTATTTDIYYFLKSPESQKISWKIKSDLMAYFQISPREFLSGKELQHVYRILNSIEEKRSNMRYQRRKGQGG